MQNIKQQNRWEGDEYWTKVGHVTIPGDLQAKPIPTDASQSEGEQIVQTWNKIAVLRARPGKGVMIGFITKHVSHMQFLNESIETADELFGVRVGDSDITFFLLPKNVKTDTTLELVEVTTLDDSRYKTLPLY